MFTYRAKVDRVVDGDTYDVTVDLGFKIYHKVRVRLRNVDTPEIFGRRASEEGRIAAAYVTDLILGKEVVITTHKTNAKSFDRWVADVTIDDYVDLGTHLIAEGYAVKWERK